MTIQFIELTYVSDAQAKAMCAWQNDPEIRHLFNVFKNQQEYEQSVSWKPLQKDLNDSSGRRFAIMQNDLFVGEFNYAFDHPAALKNTPKTAWVGIGIGQKSARGQGLGFKAMTFLENQIISDGGKRIELGVFSFNSAAIGLYEKLGFHKFETIPDFTWWDGAMHEDFRYEKLLLSYGSAD